MADFPVDNRVFDKKNSQISCSSISPRGYSRISLASLLTLLYDAAMKCCLYLLTVGILYGPFLGGSDTAKQQEAIARLEEAVSKTNIFELPSFAMRAEVHVENHGKMMDGTYELLWNGPDQWKERTSLPGYSEVQIGGKGAVWLQRSPDLIRFPIHNLQQALGFSSSVGSPQSMSLVQLGLTPNDTIKKTNKRKDHGDKLTCFEIENEQKYRPEICINEGSGIIARATPYYSDADLQPVGGRVFPRHLSIHHGNETVAEVNITELSTPAQFAPETFTPPTGVVPQAGCMNPTMPRLVKRQNPEYPPIARQQRRQGLVAIDALIGKDGVPRTRRVVESAGPDFEASSLHAVSQWRYDPAMCNGQPVEVETVVTVNYTLSY
jgi:TonB family protein